MSKVKFALVGCGRISINHINSVLQYKNEAEIVAICDTDSRALEEKAQMLPKAKLYSNINDLLSDTNADCIILTTPSGIHPSHAIKSFKKGFHVLTEKPMAVNVNDARDMIKASDEAEKHLFVVKQNRKNATLQLLKQAIDEKRFGRIYMVNCNVFWTRPQEYYDAAKWRGTWSFDGGAFMNQASHYFDLLHYLIGPVESLHSFTSTLERNIEAEDTGVVNLRWKNGAIGSMNVTMLTYPKNLEGGITILGEKGTVRIGGVAVNQILNWEFEDKKDYDEQVVKANYETTSVYGFGHPLYYRNVIDTLSGIAEPEVDGREGYKTLELITAAYRSSIEGKRIGLPLDI